MIDAIASPVCSAPHARCRIHTRITLMRQRFAPHVFALNSRLPKPNGRCEQRMHLARAVLAKAQRLGDARHIPAADGNFPTAREHCKRASGIVTSDRSDQIVAYDIRSMDEHE